MATAFCAEGKGHAPVISTKRAAQVLLFLLMSLSITLKLGE